jgi:hypothetical protein
VHERSCGQCSNDGARFRLPSQRYRISDTRGLPPLEQGWRRYVSADYGKMMANAQMTYLRGIVIGWLLVVGGCLLAVAFRDSWILVAPVVAGTAISVRGLIIMDRCGRQIREDLESVGVHVDRRAPLGQIALFQKWQARNDVTSEQLASASAHRFTK